MKIPDLQSKVDGALDSLPITLRCTESLKESTDKYLTHSRNGSKSNTEIVENSTVMETIRQILTVTADRTIEVTLPDSVKPGLVEMVIILQPLSDRSPDLKASARPSLFGFLPKHIDPIEFERQTRNEWNR